VGRGGRKMGWGRSERGERKCKEARVKYGGFVDGSHEGREGIVEE